MPGLPGMPRTVAVADPFAAVWRRLRRLDIERRNEVPIVDADEDGVVVIACGGAFHTARDAGFADGLVLDDHDLVSELSLLALGAALPACLAYAAIYDDGVHGSRFLRLWADDVEGDRVRAMREDWIGNYWE